MATILVTGATGGLGSAIINQLLKRVPAHKIAAFVRSESKAADFQKQGVDVRVGDFNDRQSLDKAMAGIDHALLISGTDEEQGMQQHRNVVDAAKQANVKVISYTGRSLKDRHTLANRMMDRHFETEDYIKASGMNYVLFKNSLYMDTIPRFLGEKVFETGVNLPTGDGRVAFALRSEQGEAIANVLAEKVESTNKVYNFTGGAAYSFADVARALSELSGKEVKFNAVEKADFEQVLRSRGMPEHMVQFITAFMLDIKAGQEDVVTSDMEKALGRKPATLKEGLKILYKL